MYRDVEEDLMRELRQVADRVEVPAMPDLPSDPPHPFVWQPMLVAAAVLVLVVGVIATVLSLDGDRAIQPAPSPTPTEAVERLTADPPTVPYVLGDVLYVGGERVPGAWFDVDGTDTGWVGVRTDGSYAWGYDAEPHAIEGVLNQPPVVSPGGGYVASVTDEDGQGMLNGFDTDPAGEGFGLGVEVPVIMQGVYSRAVAVSDDGVVIAGGADFQEVWRPLDGGSVTQLADTAPGQVVIGSTDAGLVVNEGGYDSTDGTQGSPYLATLADDGSLTKVADLPVHSLLDATTEWVAWVPPGVIEGEVATYEELSVRRLDGSDVGVLTPPDRWAFATAAFAWEDEGHLVARVTGPEGDGMVRCSPALRECVLLDTP